MEGISVDTAWPYVVHLEVKTWMDGVPETG
jgi:hypothetical protein